MNGLSSFFLRAHVALSDEEYYDDFVLILLARSLGEVRFPSMIRPM